MSNDTWKCPECDTINTEDNCIICGFEKSSLLHSYRDDKCVNSTEVVRIKFSSAEKTISTAAQNNQTYEKDSSKWYCSKCGMINNDFESRCGRCGYRRSNIPLIVISSIVMVILVFAFYYFVFS